MPVYKPVFAAALIAAALAAAPLFADEPPPSPAPPPPAAGQPAAEQPAADTLSPAVRAAITDLGADDYKTRQEAVNKLEIALGDQLRALITSNDPEIQARIISLLQFNDGLTRWVIDAYKLPSDQRKKLLDFALQPGVLPILALVFSPDPDKRAEAAHQLGKFEQPEANELLARLLQDEDRAVYIAAMETVWDRKPTDAVVDALWERAVSAAFNFYQGNLTRMGSTEEHLKFRGRPLSPINFYDNSNQRLIQDGDVATDVLIHLKAPQVAAKVRAFLEEYERAATNRGRGINIWLYSANSGPMKDALRIIAAYKSKDTLQVLYKIATSPMQQPSNGNMNGQKFFWSNRTLALGTLIEALDLKPADYKVKREPFMGGIWTTPSEADENDAIKQIKKYWADHAATLGPVHTAATESAATQSADTATEPAEPPAQNHFHVMIQPGAFRNLQIQLAPAPPATQK